MLVEKKNKMIRSEYNIVIFRLIHCHINTSQLLTVCPTRECFKYIIMLNDFIRKCRNLDDDDEDTKILCVAICSYPRTFKISRALSAFDYRSTIHVYDSSGGPCTWHDEGSGLTGVRRSSSNGTYLPEQVPHGSGSVEADDVQCTSCTSLSMQIPVSWPGYYLYLACGIFVRLFWNVRNIITLAFDFSFFFSFKICHMWERPLALQDIT